MRIVKVMEIFKDTIKLIKDIPRDFNKNEILTYASSAAFFLFLSIFPLIMLVLSIVSGTGIKQYELYQVIMMIFPDSFNEIVRGLVQELYLYSFVLASVSAILAVWSSSSGVYAIAKGLNRIYKKNDKKHEMTIFRYFIYRVGMCVHTVFLIVAIITVINIILFSKKIVRSLSLSYPHFAPILSYLGNVRLVFAFVTMTIMFILLYAALPKKNKEDMKEDRLVYHLPGAIVASVLWIIFSVMFSNYVIYVSEHSFYGSLTAIVFFMVWMYALMVVLLSGAQINSSIIAHRKYKAEMKIIKRRKRTENQIRRARLAIKKSGGNMFDI